MAQKAANVLLPRASAPAASGVPAGGSGADELLALLSSPFESQFASSSFLSAIIFSLVFTVVLALAFCFIRPYNNVVYAPRAKHADSKHAPPPVDKGLFGWIKTMIRTKEPELVEKVGLDAAVFMRFTRMMRNMFTALAVVACGILIPLNLVAGSGSTGATGLNALTPINTGYSNGSFWGYVVVAYLFDIIICYFLWTNYRAILRLRRAYFDTTEYQRSLHSRTLLLTDIPKSIRSDEGIVRVAEELRSTGDVPRAAIARNVKDLPDLVEEHEEAVRELEKHLAKYLKNPNRLPAKRPTCKVSKNDKAYSKGQEVDAIEYLTARIKELEAEVKEVRLTVDKRNAMSYGFATYNGIADAHDVAYAGRKKGPQGTIVRLAPKPTELIWNNLPLLKKDRKRRNFVNNLWIALLTLAWIVPNVLIAIFLANLNNLGKVWPAFGDSLIAHPTGWAIVQGIVAPAITTAFYYYLPAIFRRLVTKAGDTTKTGRERHVMHKLFAFFMVNNLIVFSLFAAIWTWVSLLIANSGGTEDGWSLLQNSHPFQHIVSSLIAVSPYWAAWLLQRNLGAAIDLTQLVRLTWGSFSRRFLSPTPRELIELTAPQPFEYASYYNYFLFYASVALFFGCLQPLTIAITALYFWFDSFSKKYMILYIFITKYESGGMFWKMLFNQMLVAAALGNVVVALLVVAYGNSWAMLGSLAPLAFFIGGFKWYCARTFDTPIKFYHHSGKALRDDEQAAGGEHKQRKGDKVAIRFGHPALFKPLMTPMVSAKAQHLLKQVYTGRTSVDETGREAGFSDVYMTTMDNRQPGKSTSGAAPFEVVGEHQLDYEYWKDRPEFREEHGGDGELFGHAPDYIRPGTPSSMMSGHTRPGTWDSARTRSHSRDVYSRDRSDSDTTRVNDEAGGVEYPRGYHKTPVLREQSPGPNERFNRYSMHNKSSSDALVQSAAGMGRSTPPPQLSSSVLTPGGYGPIRMGMGVETPMSVGTPYDEETSYDYFRRGRNV